MRKVLSVLALTFITTAGLGSMAGTASASDALSDAIVIAPPPVCKDLPSVYMDGFKITIDPRTECLGTSI